nr:reverse transcriptase domain-containing protein [Tanacetum cinerariifolium]
MVKKHDGSWRMCVDFTDLNKACPQDCYPLPEIDWKVESLCGYPFKCILYAYKGYHQIQLAEADEEKTAFHTEQGVYYYTKMPLASRMLVPHTSDGWTKHLKVNNKFYDFHNDKGHSLDECMQLKKQIEELVRARKLSHLIKEIKQGRDQSKAGKKETAVKDKPTAIYMVTQSFERVGEIAFPQLAASNGTEGPLIIEAEMSGHMIHRMYIDGGSSMEILYENCFNQLRPEIKNQMVPATTSLTGFSGETIWPLGKLKLLVTIGDATHSTKAWMNFMVVKSMIAILCWRSIERWNRSVDTPSNAF